jgi:hypothetical protein
MPEPSATRSSPPLPATEGKRLIFLPVVAWVMIVGSHLLWSSPEYRQHHLLLASVVALGYGKTLLWPWLRGSGWPGALALAGLLLAHAASWLGGVWHGSPPLAASGLALEGLLGVFGLAVFSVVFLAPHWRRVEKWTVLGVLSLVLAGSLIGYFMFIERYIRIGGYAEHYSTLRMALIWPTRWLTSPLGQIAWDHTNYAAYLFALALILILEFLAGPTSGRRWYWWLLGGLLCAGVFLTGSRGGWTMVGLALPLVLIGRRPGFSLKVLGLMVLAIGSGFAGLKAKIAMLPPPPSATPALTTAIHSTELVARASAGRTTGYRSLWLELAGSRTCGHGLAATGKPVVFLTHEHSTFMATLRGGGLLGLAGHALVLASAAWAAWCLLRQGCRWPAVLVVAALGGLLFDRSSVIALTGNYEFLTHWVAVLMPLLLISPPTPPAVVAAQ